MKISLNPTIELKQGLVSLWVAIAMVFAAGDVTAAKKPQPVPLSPAGEKLQERYASMLSALQDEIRKLLPQLDEQKQVDFMTLFGEQFAASKAYGASLKAAKDKGGNSGDEQNAPLPVNVAEEALTKAQARTVDAVAQHLANVQLFLASDTGDAKLVKAAVLADATTRRLAEFAQQGQEQEALVEQLLSNDGLMRQMLEAGGANGGKYGEAMQAYVAIQKASQRANQGILQRLALGTSLEMTVPFQQTYSTFLSRKAKPVDPVKRYLSYENAYLAGELDPAFEGMSAWECRFVTNNPSSDEEIAWMREMMRNYRPDLISDSDFRWRYVKIVKTDVPYGRGKWDMESSVLPMQQVLDQGGICHIRAWVGRLAANSFGIPVWGVEQTGHTALSRWTPDGWAINLGASWQWSWWGERSGLDFLLETRARAHAEDYRKVLRARWIGKVLGEESHNDRTGVVGGFWSAVAQATMQATVAGKAKNGSMGEEPAGTDESKDKTETTKVAVTDEDKKIIIAPDGVITIPAVSCLGSTSDARCALPMKSHGGGFQVHFGQPKNPESFECVVDVPHAGRYALSARVVTVSDSQNLSVKTNDEASPIAILIQNTFGQWNHTKPVELMLVQGKNVLKFARQSPCRGVSIKDFTLTRIQ